MTGASSRTRGGANRATDALGTLDRVPARLRRSLTRDRLLTALDAFALSWFGIHTSLASAGVHFERGLPGSSLLESARARILLGYLLNLCLLVLGVQYTASTQDAAVPAVCFVAGLLTLSHLRS